MRQRRLVLVRHAKATYAQGAVVDFDRPLTLRGEHDADALARWLGEHLPPPSGIVASSAPRARDTAERIAAAWPAAPAITLEPDLYEAPLEGPARLVSRFPDEWETAVVVGHNPSISHTADWLIGEPTVVELPPGGMIWMELEAEHWRDIAPGQARVHAVRVPEPRF